MVFIRRFESDDAKAVSDLIRHTIRISNSKDYDFEHIQPLIDYFSPEKILLLSRERDCLVALIDNYIVGTAAIEKDKLLTFFVHPDFQNKGIGTELLSSIESIALAGDIRLIKCEASITGVQFYKRKGYQLTGKDKDGRAGKQLGMQKELD